VRKIPLFLFFVLPLLLSACRGAATPTPTPKATATPTPTATATPTATTTLTAVSTPTATPTTAAKTASVTIQNFAYNPTQLTVDRGTRVTWTNQDSVAHTVTGSGFDSGSLGQGQTFSYTFDTPGDYSYSCSFHPTMHGQVTVK
jgi:plastocyanin